MEVEDLKLKRLFISAVKIGFEKGLSTQGVLKPYLSKSQAYKMYGRAKVDGWITKGLLKEMKDGENSSTVRIDRVEIEMVAATSNL